MKTKNPKVAVVLYGLLRTAEFTSKSFLKHVVNHLDADIFYSGYKYSDRPRSDHVGIHDKFGYMKENPKNNCATDNEIKEELLFEIYGEKLKEVRLHNETIDVLAKDIEPVDSDEILFKLDPLRFISMFYSIQEGAKLVFEYEKKHQVKYDVVIFARPDLGFYSKLDISDISTTNVLNPAGTGFHHHSGEQLIGSVQPLFYKNVIEGYCIPSHSAHFNDQLFALDRNNCDFLFDLVSDIISYMKMRVPLTPETLLYFHLCTVHDLKVHAVPQWCYEIFRHDDEVIKNITDIYLLEKFDPNHPLVLKRNTKIKRCFKMLKKEIYFYLNKIRAVIRE